MRRILLAAILTVPFFSAIAQLRVVKDHGPSITICSALYGTIKIVYHGGVFYYESNSNKDINNYAFRFRLGTDTLSAGRSMEDLIKLCDAPKDNQVEVMNGNRKTTIFTHHILGSNSIGFDDMYYAGTEYVQKMQLVTLLNRARGRKWGYDSSE